MREAGVQLTAIFSPEHGFAGKEDRPDVADDTDPATGIPVLQPLRQRTQSPHARDAARRRRAGLRHPGRRRALLHLSSTMVYALEDAAKAGIPFYVLDRPNPITGVHVEGPLLDANLHSFVGCFAMPVRHGMTMGELARHVQRRAQTRRADLHVVPMKNWQRGDWFDSTGLPWIDPSPNMRSLNAAALYPDWRCSKPRPTIRWAAAPTRPSSRSAPIGFTAPNSRSS